MTLTFSTNTAHTRFSTSNMLNWATSQLKELGVPLDTLTSVVDNITNQMAEVCAPIGSPSSPLVMSITRKDTNETLRMLQSGDINTSMDCILNSR